MAAEMKVTDAAVVAAGKAFVLAGGSYSGFGMRAALEAGLAAMLEPVGCTTRTNIDMLNQYPRNEGVIYTLDCATGDDITIFKFKESK